MTPDRSALARYATVLHDAQDTIAMAQALSRRRGSRAPVIQIRVGARRYDFLTKGQVPL